MTERERAITERVREELHDHLEDFKQHGSAYIESYIAATLSGGLTRPERRHIHPKLAEFIREIVLDVAAMERRTCGTATPDLSKKRSQTLGQSGVIASGESSRRKVAA